MINFWIGFCVGVVIMGTAWALWDYEPIKYEKRKK